MWYVYVLQSLKNKSLYVGYTADLKKRVQDHNSKNGSIYTSRNAPFRLVFYEAYLDKRDATKGEEFFKSGYGREVLKDKIKYSLDLSDN